MYNYLGGEKMYIYRYKKDSLTGYEEVEVENDYQLRPGELNELPDPCYTPMVLDGKGNLISNTLGGSNEAAKDYLANNGISNVNENSQGSQFAQLTLQVAQQQQTSASQISMLTKQVAALQQTVNGLTANKEG